MSVILPHWRSLSDERKAEFAAEYDCTPDEMEQRLVAEVEETRRKVEQEKRTIREIMDHQSKIDPIMFTDEQQKRFDSLCVLFSMEQEDINASDTARCALSIIREQRAGIYIGALHQMVTKPETLERLRIKLAQAGLLFADTVVYE